MSPRTAKPNPEPYRGPAPLYARPDEPIFYTRIRALQLAEHHDLIGEYVGIVDAAETDPSRARYMLVAEPGRKVADLKRNEEPQVWHASEVLPFCYERGRAAGLAEQFAYREGLPGWKPPTQPAAGAAT